MSFRVPDLRPAAFALLFTLTACNGFDTGFNPRPDVRKEQGPLIVPPPSVVRGESGEPGQVYTPTKLGAGPISLRCAPRAGGLGSDCRPQ